ncbi:hypothetical protein PFICI_11545 [Pestalotiopsis fici W106-1]|uniref:BRCT domain-containing protein n=1 Tax=Pestalotiopsis fici (strain W106-1 / CGMCC3.15140) TaxID=1229662 RepID=W3WQN9_PESFW|nr:uncharacterized protein PFICI_11545 [Pestalotiopsis fici W106-1]ETS76158.1 hypothetical protein PFICI_11545 [Pestalotiopsis fici W106-1]
MAAKPKSVQAAEKRAYDGQNESQDSQTLMERYHSEHGIGTTDPMLNKSAGSLNFKDVNAKVESAAQSTRVGKSTKLPNDDALEPETRPIDSLPLAFNSDHRPCSSYKASSPRSSHALETGRSQGQLQTLRDAGLFSAIVDRPSLLTKNGVLRPVAPPKVAGPLRTETLKNRKMDDLSPESPTQSNDGRSYEQYRSYYEPGLASSQPSKEQEQQRPSGLIDQAESQISRASSSHEHRTLHEDETGAVKFDWNPLENDGHDEVTPSELTGTSQPNAIAGSALERGGMPAPTMLPPETPLVPSRMFQSNGTASDLMGASQLFQQTQFTSGAKKLASPTSSRPSPMIFNHNTISPNNASSPLKDRGLRTSPLQGPVTSPACSAPATSSVVKPREQQEPDIVLETIPGSPNAFQSKLRHRPDPIGDYAPIRNSPDPYNTLDRSQDQTDSDDDNSQERRRLARQRQERANRSLTNITLPKQCSKDNIEVPSTNRRKKNALAQSTVASSIEVIKPRLRPDVTSGHDSQETVADSQEVSGTTIGVPNSEESPAEKIIIDVAKEDVHSELPSAPQQSDETNETNGTKETIPETSPPGSRLPKRSTQPTKVNSTEQRTLRSSGRINQSSRLSSEETREVPSSPPLPAPIAASTQGPPRRSSKSRPAATPIPPNSAGAVSENGPPTTSSTLTVLTETPQPTSSSTPNTDTNDVQESENRDHVPTANNLDLSSPAAAKNSRQKPTRLKTYSSPRNKRHASVSTDELAFSTPNSALAGRTSRSFLRKSVNETRQHHSNAGLFHGMTFATSFQSDREKQSVEKMITAGGGTIVTKGFDDLVEVGPLESDEIPRIRYGQNLGFAALITDTHSRKPKYMQALALGLPCLSWKWISECTQESEVVDWSTYLLAAGHSQVLGTIRSRPLDLYDAKTTSIERIIEKRPRMLIGSKILLVMKKSKREEEKRMQYVFLAQVLGASLHRVSTLEEARAELKKNEDAGNAFDWVYVDGHPTEAEKILFGQGLLPSKKRKIQSTVDSAEEQPCPKRVRTLTDELVVQSLILGRMVKDGELGATSS